MRFQSLPWLALAAMLTDGCATRTQFSDMQRTLDQLDVPEKYEFVSESETGTNPSFFGAHPELSRNYHSPDPAIETCDELVRLYGDRASGRIRREPNACAFSFRTSTGVAAIAQLNFKYHVYIQAVRFPGDASTKVRFRVVDTGP